MRILSFSILLMLFALVSCKNNVSVKNNVATAYDESSLPVTLNTPEKEGAVTDFVDEYAQYEYFDLNRYIVDEKDIPADSIEHINETCFVQIWRVEIKEFEDEESDEAQAYFIAMDDLGYYMFESSEKMKALGLADTTVKQRFLRFDVADSTLVVDVEKGEQKISALLYKKGQKPLIIDITDSNTSREKSYLGID